MAFLILMHRYNIAMRDAQKIIDLGRMICNEELVTIKNAKIFGDIKVLKFYPSSKGIEPIFRTKDFMIFEKPSGILVHPKEIESGYSMLDEIRHYGTPYSNPTHRIDKETSGLLLASTNKKAESKLKQMFERREIKKSYLAWVRGNTKEYFEVEEPILKRNDYSSNKHKVEINSKGKYAKTIFKKLQYDAQKDCSLVQAFPLTGRTHQIRIHLFHVKHPILGDPLYGIPYSVAEDYLDGKLSVEDRVKLTGAKRLMLHANELDFTLNGNRFLLKSKVDFTDVKDILSKVEEQKFY